MTVMQKYKAGYAKPTKLVLKSGCLVVRQAVSLSWLGCLHSVVESYESYDYDRLTAYRT